MNYAIEETRRTARLADTKADMARDATNAAKESADRPEVGIGDRCDPAPRPRGEG